MQVQERDITYEVTISEELRALMRARAASVDVPPVGTAERGVARPEVSVGVFANRRLRVDGRRPLTVAASEIATFRIGPPANASTEPAGGESGHHSLAILLTEDGNCLAHMVAEPSEGTPARPVYHLGQMQTSGDVIAMIRRCRADFEACAACAAKTGGADAADNLSRLLGQPFVQLEESLAPFVKTPRN